MTIVKAKEIKANEAVYSVVPEVLGVGTVTFLADIPKGAIVTGVFVNGKSLEDFRFEAYRLNGEGRATIYPRSEELEGHKVVAVFVSENCGGELYALAVSGGIKSFVVEYIETATAIV